MSKILIDRSTVEQVLEAWDGGDTEWFKRAYAVMEALRAALAEPVAVDVESALQAVAEKIGDQCAVWYGIGARDVEAVLREAARCGLVHGALAEPVHPAIPLENSREAADAIEATLAEYGHPTNPVNAARAGWRAARLYTAPPQRPAEPVQEPVAWRFEARHIDSAWAAAVTLKHPGPEGVYMRNVMPLYAHPPQRKPLTEEEIVALIHPIVMADMPDEMTDYEIARAIERAIKRAHGIGGKE